MISLTFRNIHFRARVAAITILQGGVPSLSSWRHLSGGANSFKIIDPTTEELIADVKADTEDQVAAKVARAVAAQREWANTPLQTRKDALLQFTHLLGQEKQNLAALLCAEMGKPIKQAISEIAATQSRIKFLVENAAQVLEPKTMSSSGRVKERVEYQPLGTVANISAWNYPYFVSSSVFAAALLTGNTVVYKPSEVTALTGGAMTILLHQAGVPEETFVLTQGGGPTGQALTRSPGLGGIFFTGSLATGRNIARQAAENFTRLQLELGGKDPVYVRADVPDVGKVAAALADGAFYNNGQSCCSVERIYVAKEIAEEFIAAFAETVRGFRMGCPTEEDTYLGPLARKDNLAHLKSQVDDAVAKGARQIVGQSDFELPIHGWYFPPTVLTQVDHTMDIMRDESFGPVVGIQVVSGDEEAVALMDDTTFGLTAGVYTPDEEAALKILRELDTGTGYWNCCDRVSARLPWSGRRNSGIGSTLSIEGLRAFVQPKALHLQG
eukprot:CAMPEP_0196577412 /NCGR_PEP_ID=MMETSP1081-20130531/6478_1 /TAXON_ID=36882 /ORGANISM="Pyramimonas amylifera, Strain CCMP720" /LENGTH=497 /DNA_ID=CAMNT_0041896335 /DNA_START=260 /DNA_END=1753 /DNA_ORIENTATION=-